MNKSESIKELVTALSKVQGEIRGAKKDASNPFFNKKYADLSAVWDACRESLTKHGLAVIQTTQESSPDEVIVETTLAHSSGEWVSGVLVMKPVKSDPQGIGSCLTYARRYALSAIVGVAPEDDDGNQASNKHDAPSKPETATAPSGRSSASAIKKLVEDNPMTPVIPLNEKPEATPDPEVDQEPRTWQETKVHLGKKYIGKTLGELEVHAVEEIYNSFNPKPKNGHMDLRDVYLKHALTMWKKEMDTLV